MKTYIKAIVLPALLIMTVSTTSAQTKRNSAIKKVEKTTTTTKRTTTTTNRSNTNNRRVSSSKVNYKKPTRKVASVRSVPNRKVVKHKGQTYYYANNKFYTQSRGRYIVIAPKVGFRVNQLPAHYKRVRHNTHNYYNVDGTFYIETVKRYFRRT